MKKSLIGGAVTLVLIMGQVNADEVTCPAVADIHRNIEALEDIFSVDAHDGHEWKSESLVAVVDASTLQFKANIRSATTSSMSRQRLLLADTVK
jgi:hypothetical protein